MQGLTDSDNSMDMRKRYIGDGSFSPMGEMHNLLAMGNHIRLHANNSGNLYRSQDRKIFFLNGRPIVIARVQGRRMRRMKESISVQARDKEVLMENTREDSVCKALHRIFKELGFWPVEQQLTTHTVLSTGEARSAIYVFGVHRETRRDGCCITVQGIYG